MKSPSIKTLKNKADRLFQELGKKLYTNCCICGGEYSCLHHFIHRSQSLVLRWDIKNGVPVCHCCHCRIHAKNDPIDIWAMQKGMEQIFFEEGGVTLVPKDKIHYEYHGFDWVDYITNNKRRIFKPNKTNLREAIENLQRSLDENNTNNDSIFYSM